MTELQPCDVWLDSLTELAQRFPSAPPAAQLSRLQFEITSALGPLTLRFRRGSPVNPEVHPLLSTPSLGSATSGQLPISFTPPASPSFSLQRNGSAASSEIGSVCSSADDNVWIGAYLSSAASPSGKKSSALVGTSVAAAARTASGLLRWRSGSNLPPGASRSSSSGSDDEEYSGDGGSDEEGEEVRCYVVMVRSYRGEVHQEMGAAGGKLPNNGLERRDDWGKSKLITWGQLRRAALNGCRVQATVVAFPSTTDEPRLLIPGLSPVTAGCGELNGPFADVVVTAGNRQFRAHRLVLCSSTVLEHLLSSSASGSTAGGAAGVTVATLPLHGADAWAAELLLQHMYGHDLEIWLSEAVQLYSLAERYGVRSRMAAQLRLWLSAVHVVPELLSRILPAAHESCPQACRSTLYSQASRCLVEILDQRPNLVIWPLDLVTIVMSKAQPMASFGAATAWVTAQSTYRRDEVTSDWSRLLAAVQWSKAGQDDLREIMRSKGGDQIPGLRERLWEALDAICTREARVVAALKHTARRVNKRLELDSDYEHDESFEEEEGVVEY